MDIEERLVGRPSALNTHKRSHDGTQRMSLSLPSSTSPVAHSDDCDTQLSSVLSLHALVHSPYSFVSPLPSLLSPLTFTD